MTDSEIQAERQYRMEERLAILAANWPPNFNAREMAKIEADEWVEDQRRVEALERIHEQAKTNRRDYAIKRQCRT